MMASGAIAAGGGGGALHNYTPSYSTEMEDGTNLMRITLDDHAMQRLGVAMAEIGETIAERSFILGGTVVDTLGTVTLASATENGAAATTGTIAIQVSEDAEFSSDLPIRVRIPGSMTTDWFTAMPALELESGKSLNDDDTHHYSFDHMIAKLPVGAVVLVEVPYRGNGESHLVVPYSAVIYDRSGDEWVYISPEPGVFVRRAVDVSYIDGDRALISEGPEIGTQIVSVGAAELLGIEYGVGH